MFQEFILGDVTYIAHVRESLEIIFRQINSCTGSEGRFLSRPAALGKALQKFMISVIPCAEKTLHTSILDDFT